jgi:hypothetical protein
VKWDPDKQIRMYEPAGAPGTTWQRVLMDAFVARQKGLKVPADVPDSQSLTVWSLGIGMLNTPKYFVYGHTMRECFLRLHRQQSALRR